MSQGNAVSPRCVRCRMQAVLCICEHIPTVQTRTSVCIVLHKMEQYKTSNTGHLASLALPTCEIRVRGEREEPLEVADWFSASHHTYVLFPSEDAVALSEIPRDKPTRIIVPDATWQQARRIVRRTEALDAAPKVTLPPGLVSEYDLRKRKREGGVCTLEAITAALCALEGEHVRAPLQHLLDIFVDRMLWSRGKLKKEDVLGGIPHAALHQHGGRSSGHLAPAFERWRASQQSRDRLVTATDS